jgi:hypothetical protein
MLRLAEVTIGAWLFCSFFVWALWAGSRLDRM